MRRPTFIVLAAVLVTLMPVASASGSGTGESTLSKTSRASAAAGPQIPRPPIPTFLRRLFRVKPPLVTRSVPRVRPAAPRPSFTTRVVLSVDVFALKYAPTTADARKALRRIFNRDQYERVSVYAFCWGADQLADYRANPSAYFGQLTWRRILFDFLGRYVEDYAVPPALQVVNSWTSVWNMAQINPAAAAFYVRACYGRL